MKKKTPCWNDYNLFLNKATLKIIKIQLTIKPYNTNKITNKKIRVFMAY